MTDTLFSILSVVCGILALSGLFILSADSRKRRIAVLEALIGGPRLGREIPLGIGVRYVVLMRMEVDGMIDSDPEAPDCGNEWRFGRIYHITDSGRRVLGDHDR